MAKLHYIGSEDYLVSYKCNSSIEELCEWYKKQEIIQFDTETTKTNSIVDRELRVMQFGNLAGDEVFVVQRSYITDEEFEQVKQLLCIDHVIKIIQNASFDYQVMLKYGAVMENVWDTMIQEQILYAGYDYDLRFFSLAEMLMRRYYIDISKEMQCEFGDDKITDEKLVYAATDVIHLGRLYLDQKRDLIKEDLIQLGVQMSPYNVDSLVIPAVTENEVVLAFADIEYYGMGFDPIKWKDNIAKAQPIVNDAKNKLTEVLLTEPYLSKGLKLDVTAKVFDSEGKERKVETKAILGNDQFTINWNSSTQVLAILKYIFPSIEKASAVELKKFLHENDPNAPKFNSKGKPMSVNSKEFLPYVSTLDSDWFTIIKLILLKKFDVVENALILNFKDKLVGDNYLLPKHSVMINWNSNPAKLAVFRWFDKDIKSTDSDVVEEHSHIPFFKSFQQYQFANSLLTKYGEKFIEKYVDSDGRVRTRFNTILSTGRVSSSSPNQQNIPAKALPKDRQNDYRNCFVPGFEEWKIVDSDFCSQELAVVQALSKDPVFYDALSTGKDLHSVAAEKVYKDKWLKAKSDTCEYYALGEGGLPQKQKCSCPKHQSMRDDVKTINFGLIYGITEFSLSRDLNITVSEAKTLMTEYFIAFPRIGETLTAFGMYGQTHGYIRTVAPMRRKRYFPYWKGFHQTPEYLLGKIDRASKNCPMQGSSADMVKISLVMLRREYNKLNLRDKIQPFAQVHDQLSYSCHKDYAEFWAEKVTYFMELAAKICLGNDLLKSDTQITEKWQK